MKLLLIIILTVTINAPVFEGAIIVTGTAPPDEAVTLRVIQDPTQSYTTQVNEQGVFQFNLDTPLKTGYIVQVTNGDAVDYALVERPVARWYFPLMVRSE